MFNFQTDGGDVVLLQLARARTSLLLLQPTQRHRHHPRHLPLGRGQAHTQRTQIHHQEAEREGRGGLGDLRLEVRRHGDRQVLPARSELIHDPHHGRLVPLGSASHRHMNPSKSQL